ncbi:conserved hypothetical protein [Verticillium alfalfae VaMs.102]|uniref:Uncharacterized protein n=1 Tax=Verticillium alfalfae (strain VaMs.102 / ATCC MYA-4576 / FGSC 10136) TaxID=526221 RepID=C9SV07_VERA1|nr:conserved hypothetical protein [Verticillium alfalfae VaMs.102]EEY22622.1 conserved hypothetical protein [Verticillium alfalfae VaMs.102]
MAHQMRSTPRLEVDQRRPMPRRHIARPGVASTNPIHCQPQPMNQDLLRRQQQQDAQEALHIAQPCYFVPFVIGPAWILHEPALTPGLYSSRPSATSFLPGQGKDSLDRSPATPTRATPTFGPPRPLFAFPAAGLTFTGRYWSPEKFGLALPPTETRKVQDGLRLTAFGSPRRKLEGKACNFTSIPALYRPAVGHIPALSHVMLSPSVSVPAADGPRGSGRPLDSPPNGMRASHHLYQTADANAAPTGRPLAQDRQGAHPTVPSTAIPAPATLNSSRQPTSRPLSLGPPHATPSSLQQHFRHQRHQSSTELRPAAVYPSAPGISSPTNERTPRPRSIDMPFTGDTRAGRSPESGARSLLSSWLPGPASPSEMDNPSSTPSKSLRNNMTPLNTNASPNTSRFAFISSSLSALTKSATSPTRKAKHDDELLNMNIHDALFPPSASPAGSRDAFSPASFKNLEMTAVALLTKFQHAYESQSAALREMEVERRRAREGNAGTHGPPSSARRPRTAAA